MSKESRGNFTQNDFILALENGNLELVKECLKTYSGNFSFDNSDASLDDHSSQICRESLKNEDPLKPLNFTVHYNKDKQKSAEMADLLLKNGARITDRMKKFKSDLRFMVNYGYEQGISLYLPLIKVFAFHSDIINNAFDFEASKAQAKLISDAIDKAKQLRKSFNDNSNNNFNETFEELKSSHANEIIGKDLTNLTGEYLENIGFFEATKQPKTSIDAKESKAISFISNNQGHCIVS